MADYIQILLEGGAVLVVLLLFVTGATNKKIKGTQVIVCLAVFVFLLAVVGFRFDYEGNPNNDLSRYIYSIEILKNTGFRWSIPRGNDFEVIYTLIANAAAYLPNYHLFPFITVLIEYSIYAYILASEAQRFEIQGIDILLCIVVKLSLLPAIMSISGARSTLAATLFCLGIYLLERKNPRVAYTLMISSCFIHFAALVYLGIYILSNLIYKKQKLVPLMAVWGGALGLIINLMGNLQNTEIGMLLYQKTVGYAAEENYTNMRRVRWMMPGLIMLALICLVYLYFSRSPYSKGSFFYVVVLAVNFGACSVMPTLSNRLCYVLSSLFPLLFSEIQHRSSRHKKLIHLYFYIAGIVFFIFTRWGWIRELVQVVEDSLAR